MPRRLNWPLFSVALTPGIEDSASCWLKACTAKSFQISIGTTSSVKGIDLMSTATRVPLEDCSAL